MLMYCFNSKAQFYKCLGKCFFHNSFLNIVLDILDCLHVPIVDFIVVDRLCRNICHLSNDLLQNILHNILANIFLKQLVGNLFQQWLKQLILFYPLINHKQFSPFHSFILDRIFTHFAQFHVEQFLKSFIQQELEWIPQVESESYLRSID